MKPRESMPRNKASKFEFSVAAHLSVVMEITGSARLIMLEHQTEQGRDACRFFVYRVDEKLSDSAMVSNSCKFKKVTSRTFLEF